MMTTTKMDSAKRAWILGIMVVAALSASSSSCGVAAFSPPLSSPSFVRSSPSSSSSSSALYNGRVDTSDAVAAALAASKEHGPTSREARLAWDEVEEMDASDNR